MVGPLPRHPHRPISFVEPADGMITTTVGCGMFRDAMSHRGASFGCLGATGRGPPRGGAADRLCADGEALHAPHLLDLDVAQVLRRYALAAALDAARGSQALEHLAALPLRRYPPDVLRPRIWALRHTVPASDAAYLALAEALAAPLVPRDAALAASRVQASASVRIVRLYAALTCRRTAFSGTSTSGITPAALTSLMSPTRSPPSSTGNSGGQCLTHVGREGDGRRSCARGDPAARSP